MDSRSDIAMSRWRFLRYLDWMASCWELREVEELAFAYHALRRMGA